MAWAPGDPWPGTAGGAYNAADWGPYVRLYVFAAIYAGASMRWGSHANSRLNQGNVWSGGSPAGPTPPTGTLWADLTCDTLSVATQLGARPSASDFPQGEAATCDLILRDLTRQYDPLNVDSPYQYQGNSRLVRGTPLKVFAEVVNAATSAITRFNLFNGTIDSWAEEWTRHNNIRRVNVSASDNTKQLVAVDRAEQPAVGAGETVNQRITRILTFASWLGTSRLDASTVTLQATTLAQSAWELIGRATGDEIGFTFVDQNGALQFYARATWSALPAPTVTVGCKAGVTAHDVIETASPSVESLVRNQVFAARTGGTEKVSQSDASMARNGTFTHSRSDLGLADDAQSQAWGDLQIGLFGWPRPRLDSVELLPVFDSAAWPVLLGLRCIADRVRVVWQPPVGTAYDTTGRLLGVRHSITRHRWSVGLNLFLADLFARRMKWGQAGDLDTLTTGNVWN